MKTRLFVTVALLSLFTMSLSASQATVTGILTDDMCTKKHMMPGKANAVCVRECIKHGAKYVVVAEGKVLEITGDKDQFRAFAGKKVRLTGQNKGKSFTVVSIEAEQ